MACGGPQPPAATPSSRSAAPSPSPSPVAISPSPSPPVPQRLETALPVPLEESGAAAAGGKLYVIGGFDAAGNSLRTVWVLAGIAWSAGPRLPLRLDHTSAATLADRIYLAGGHSLGRDTAPFFPLGSSTSPQLAPLRRPRRGHTPLPTA